LSVVGCCLLLITVRCRSLFPLSVPSSVPIFSSFLYRSCIYLYHFWQFQKGTVQGENSTTFTYGLPTLNYLFPIIVECKSRTDNFWYTLWYISVQIIIRLENKLKGSQIFRKRLICKKKVGAIFQKYRHTLVQKCSA
jgi:hypothetical protein